MKKALFFALCGMCITSGYAQKQYSLTSPDGNLKTTIMTGDTLSYDILYKDVQVMHRSPAYVTLENGDVWGIKSKVRKVKEREVREVVASPFYRSAEIEDHYNEIVLEFDKKWKAEFRMYNDGIAYRFVNENNKPFNIKSESVEYRFDHDDLAYVPYVNRGKDGNFESQFFNSFENTYTECKVSEVNPARLAFLPLMVQASDDVKVCITESHLENYPGLYLLGSKGGSLVGVHAACPSKVEQGGHNRLQMLVKGRENYIAKIEGKRSLPWRIAVVSDDDRTIAATNLSYLLGAPSRVDDISWIKPGKVAWEWWNDWNLDGVDFKTGVNNDTYKAYIDFASKNGIEYVILDEGWAVNLKADLMQVVKDIDIKELVDYGAERNVGIILWAGYHAFNRDMENVCRHYSELGVKGFKVDFMDRDDQDMTAFNYRAAAMCAKYKMILDLHGTSKPAGLNRTYPNVLNFEGVHGLEQMKWSPSSVDQVKYDVMIPFLRQVAGPMDYTQGAMRNATRSNYYPCNSEPMSQGTRCRQLALYIVLDSPFNMLCDSPSNYAREQECTDFISSVPTVWDETRILKGKMGKYIVTARRSGDTWYVGGINDWDATELDVDLSFIPGVQSKKIEMFTDGINAHRAARDYKKSETSVSAEGVVKVSLAPGGGFVMKID